MSALRRLRRSIAKFEGTFLNSREKRLLKEKQKEARDKIVEAIREEKREHDAREAFEKMADMPFGDIPDTIHPTEKP
jgi:hypothetical protein